MLTLFFRTLTPARFFPLFIIEEIYFLPLTTWHAFLASTTQARRAPFPAILTFIFFAAAAVSLFGLVEIEDSDREPRGRGDACLCRGRRCGAARKKATIGG